MAAGLGFKTFTTGEVLTAADTNGYLMQGINVFANAAARTTAITSPQEGQYSYLKDTNALEYYDGAAWVGAPVGDITAVTAGKGLTGGGSSGDVTVSLATTAKGDLVAGSGTTTAAVLTVGSNGETLVADSSATTGLRYQGNFAAGKNKIINGDFGIWQRGTSFNLTTSAYTADRFQAVFDGSGSTRTYSRQTFTAGSAPVAGYESQYFFRLNQSVAGTSGTFNVIAQLIEDVRTFAGQTITFSFWAKADASRNIAANVIQNFGSGGSSEVFVGQPINVNLTTSWVRYTGTVTVPSISGKTIGTNSFLKLEITLPTNTVMTIDTWGWQAEAGSVATAFQTATGTLAGELAACERYYERTTPGVAYGRYGFANYNNSTSIVVATVEYKTTKRIIPTALDYANLRIQNNGIGTVGTITNIAINVESTNKLGQLTVTVGSGAATGANYSLMNDNNTAGYLGFSAEL